MSSALGYHALVDALTNELIGYCCFGPEARVPGLETDDAVVDVGVGLRPDLVGGGWGPAVTASVLNHGAQLYAGHAFRVAVHAWNERSLRTVRHAGFQEHHRLKLPDGREFVVLIRAS